MQSGLWSPKSPKEILWQRSKFAHLCCKNWLPKKLFKILLLDQWGFLHYNERKITCLSFAKEVCFLASRNFSLRDVADE